MRGTWRVLLMLFAALLTSVNAAPPFTSHQTYVGRGLHRVLVFANVADMSLRQHMEFRIVQGFTDRRIQAVSSMAVLPPAYQFSDLRTDSLVGAQGADALLLVTVGAPGAESIPFQPATSKSDGGIAGPDTSAPHPVPSQRWIAARGGLWPWTSFKAVLLATRTSRGVWGGIATGEDEHIRKMVDSYCDEVVWRLAVSGVLAIVAGLEPQGSIDAPYIINTEGGGQVGARALELTGNGFLHFVDPGGKDEYIAAYKVRSIFDSLGIDRTSEVLVEGKTLP